MSNRFLLIFFILLCFLLLSLFVNNNKAFASAANTNNFTVTTGYYASSGVPTSLQDAPNCPQSCNVVGTCTNSFNQDNCGQPTCDGGNAWTKYNIQSCKEIAYDQPSDGLTCQAVYTQDQVVYSIGDKCVSGEYGLRPSSCTNIMGDSLYKTCCTNTSPSFVTTNSCVPFAGDTTNPPWEGTCPAGTSEKFCGFGGYPACGQPACGLICKSK